MAKLDTDVIRAARQALQQDPDDAVRRFTLADALDGEGREQEAIPLYEKAIEVGLDDALDLRAQVQLGSSLRNIGHTEDAIRVLASAAARYPDSVAARLFLALALADAGRATEAVADLVHLTANGYDSRELDLYREPLHRYADDLRA